MSCPRFIAESFAVRTAAHLAHFSTTSYAQHVALDEFYSSIVDLADKYAEVYMGLAARIENFPAVATPRGDIAGVLDDYLDLVHGEMKEDNDSQALMNILAEIEELTARTLYKLRNLS